MEDALVHLSKAHLITLCKVLILVLMEDALVHILAFARYKHMMQS